MLLRSLAVAAMAAMLAVTAGDTQPRPDEPRIAADRIAAAGHAMAFDAKLRPIAFDEKVVAAMQQSMLGVLAQAPLRQDDKLKAFTAGIRAELARARTGGERALLNAALINRLLAAADEKLRTRYDWRNRIVYEQQRSLLDRRFQGRFEISEAILRWLREGGLIVIGNTETGYMGECRGQQVPVPPNFRTTAGTAWVNQGNLTANILDPGQAAAVWTWTDPARRGACVALPRRNGGTGTFAGIICQSAVTGRACFWDNLTRADPGRRIPTATETMVIRDLQDGRTLAEGAPCTECHTGNNVYLMSPDDPTWRKIIKGPMSGPRPGTFTTIVEPQTDSPGGPRYTPIAHASWVNPPLAAGCSGVCHGAPSASVQTMYFNLPAAQRPAMPPACRNPGNNYRNCYGTP